MDQITFLWTLAAKVLAGVHVFLQKVVAQEKRSSAFNGLLMYGISGAVALTVLFTLTEIPGNWAAITVVSMIGGIVHGLGNFVRIESLKYIDSVLYFPINKVLGPLIVLIGGVLIFGDSLSIVQSVGIALSLTVPLLLVSSVEYERQNNLRLGLILLVVSTVLTGGSTLIAKEALNIGSVLFVIATGQVAGTATSLAILYREYGRELHKKIVLESRDIYLGVLSGILAFFSSYALLVALDRGVVSIVYVIHAHYILIPIILSVWWYRDHIDLRKFIAVAVSFLAIGLLYEA